MRQTLGLFEIFRIRQQIKNLLVIVPFFFSLNLWYSNNELGQSFLIFSWVIGGVLVFSLASWAVYLFNDVIDADMDLIHESKRNRPIARGTVSKFYAISISLILFLGTPILAFFLSTGFCICISIYLIMNIFYSLLLKQIVIIDVITVALGFVIRALSGVFIIRDSGIEALANLQVSPWFYLCTGFGALFIVLMKRQGELEGSEQTFITRPTLRMYSPNLLLSLINISSAATIITYSLYTVSGKFGWEVNVPSDNSMIITVPLVIIGIFRYMYLCFEEKKGESPEKIITSDIFLIIVIMLWLLTSIFILLFRG